MAEETKTTPPALTPDNTRPDEKALADKLMEELKASGVDVSKMNAPAAPSPATAPSAAPAPAAKPKIKLPSVHLPFKKKETPAPAPAAPASAAPTPEEQPASVEAQQLTNEALMEMIDKKLEKISGDEFIVIKISKQGLLILFGVVLVLLWMIPAVSNIGSMKLPSVSVPMFSFSAKPTVEPTAAPTPVPSPTPVPVSIRIRIGSEEAVADDIKTLLQPIGADRIDVVKDDQVNQKQVLVVTRNGQDMLREQISSLLRGTYTVASEAATLTDDSDFTATILVGKNAKK